MSNGFKTHSNENRIVCPFCDNEHDPYSQGNVDRMDWENLEEFEFECSDCKRVFKVEMRIILISWDSEPTEEDSIWDKES
jgi:hypothetical protein